MLILEIRFSLMLHNVYTIIQFQYLGLQGSYLHVVVN